MLKICSYFIFLLSEINHPIILILDGAYKPETEYRNLCTLFEAVGYRVCVVT